ncbi:MAG: DNA adenine methylase [Treponema sp.]|nr:DNA adenine methylase [Treponema sp.]
MKKYYEEIKKNAIILYSEVPMSSIPHLVQYQGSKRNLAGKILDYIPNKCDRIIEPFAGTAAITMACATHHIADKYIINDLNKPLIELLNLVVNEPKYVSSAYTKTWNGQTADSISHYYKVREEFNQTKDPVLFLYLLARCVKGAVRYNSEGMFNQSPDKRRRGTAPKTMEKNIHSISYILKGKIDFYSEDYKILLQKTQPGDIVYMDPPYQGVCGDRDSRYFAGISHCEFVEELRNLHNRGISFIVSYDGKLGKKSYGKELPKDIGLEHVFLNAGRSSQATLLGKKDETIESLYVTRDLIEVVEKIEKENQNELFERVS